MRRGTARPRAAALLLLAVACSGNAPTSAPTTPAPETPEPGPTATVSPAPVEEVFDAREAFGDLCSQGAEPVYRLPAPVYSGTYNFFVTGYKEVGKLQGEACGTAEVLSRAPVFPSEAKGRLPSRRELRTARKLGSSPGMWIRIRSGSLRGWIELNTTIGSFLPARPGQEVLEGLPIEVPEPLKPGGLPDLTFREPRPLSEEGDPCVPGQFIPNTYNVAIRNAGSGTGPVGFAMSITGAGGMRDDVDQEDWMRGLEPGEEFSMAPFPDGTHFSIDPANRVAESDEGNNELTLAPLPFLVCN